MSRMVFERNPVSRKLIQHALSGAHAQPFWISDLGDVASYPQLTATTHYDLAIVGGGYTGLWSALLAKQRIPALKD